MSNWEKVLFIVPFSFFVIIIALAITFSKEPNKCYYEWQDALGNYGTAKSCYTKKGNLICETNDATRAVINYTRICKK